MKVSVLAIVTGFAALASAAPAPVHLVHEKRSPSSSWSRRDLKINRNATIPMSIGLKQRNLENGYQLLMDVSHPESSNFGKHWSPQKIKETFKPSDDAIAAVKAWLIESGIESERIKMSDSLTWVKFDASVAEAESLLKTEYNIYTQATTGDDHLACEEYSVPAHIKEHVDFITPTTQFDAIVKLKGKRSEVAGHGLKIKPTSQLVPDPLRVPLSEVKFNLTNCNRYITPECLRTLYSLPEGTSDLSSFAVVEYTPEAYLQPDLNLFYSAVAPNVPTGTGPGVTDLIDGAVVQTTNKSFYFNAESDLDLEYAIALVYPQKVTLYQAGDEAEGASFNNLLDALDGSYCTGDDPNYDAIYPDPLPGGYTGPEDCGTIKPTSVISTSYAYNEADLPPSYEERQCNEYLKLGLAGVTVLYSSGDYGVAGNQGKCCVLPGCAGGEYNNGSSGTFNPSFPGTCPYITSVGATQVKHDYSVTATDPEAACETVIYSGGGFSNVFPIPDYQTSAVGFYFDHHKPSYNSSQYNDSQKARGFPDISANGANFVIGMDGALSLVYGTSASTPVMGSIISLINNERAKVGKGSVGFLNPTLYANPGALKDITLGDNQGCGTKGFRAVKGWDPLTGLGTPDYPALLEVFMALP